MTRRTLLFGIVLLVAGMAAVPVHGTRGAFIPDWTFKGSALTGWKVLGQADWKAENGELVGTPKTADGGWLVFDKSFQDIQVGADVRCPDGCKTGVLLRVEKLATGGMKGVFVSIAGAEVASYAVTLDDAGKELTRERLRGDLGNMVRFAPSAAEAAAAAAGRGARGAGAGQPAGAPAGAPPGAPAAAPGGAGGAGAAAAAGPARGAGGGGGRGRGLVPNDWNDINIVLDSNALRPIINTALTGGGAADETVGKFGPIALYVGGTASVRFRDVSYKDLGLKRWEKEQLSANFRMQRVNPFYYAFSVAAADVDRDGNMDFVSGPFVYMGPTFTTAREFYAAETINPSTQFSSNWVAFAGDYTGDGWPDVLLASTSGSKLYVNPKGEARRWDVYPNIIPPGGTQAEISAMKDIDGDGKLDLVYGSAGAIRWAKPDLANPTGPWLSVQVGEAGTYAAHGIGAGDINGDGRVDIVNGTGWWEQPAKGTAGTWPFHAANFGRGGAEMAVFDINGDGRNDVVTSIMAHGFGLAWFGQKRDASGAITFEQHTIFDTFATPDNAGGVAFSEPHGSTMGDINGDGIPDFVVGKRFFSHKETYLDPDPYGAPVLYAYLTVRDPKAPGGARFVPELIHNQSGAGSQVMALDMNKDGIVDVLTTTTHGSFVFFGKPRAGVKTVAAK